MRIAALAPRLLVSGAAANAEDTLDACVAQALTQDALAHHPCSPEEDHVPAEPETRLGFRDFEAGHDGICVVCEAEAVHAVS